MPSDLAFWLVSSPLIDNDPSRTLQDVKPSVAGIVGDQAVASLQVPGLQAGTLSNLLTLSDTLPKQDAFFTQTVSKLLDTLRSLLNDDAAKLELHTRVNDRPLNEYLFPTDGSGWKWDAARWGKQGKVAEVVENLTKEMNSIDSIQKSKLQSYNLAKGSLTAMQRKMTGNLATRSLGDIVSQSNFQTSDSEFMETLLVAVPKNLAKEWAIKYERLSAMVVPRSSAKIAEDEEFILNSVTIFKKVKEDFAQKCRENKFILRDFTYDAEAIEKQRKDFQSAGAEEKELWADLLRLSRTNFSEAYKVLVHLKVARLFVESVLRYGLPAEYGAVVIRPEPKSSAKLLKSLSSHYSFLTSKSDPSRRPGAKKASVGMDDLGGEFASVMEEEYLSFVCMEVPIVN